jgi:hypothetical protein
MLLGKITAAIADRAVQNESRLTKKDEVREAERVEAGNGERVGFGGLGWQEGMSDQELILRWTLFNWGRNASMLTVVVVGSAAWLVLPAGNRELGWWID